MGQCARSAQQCNPASRGRSKPHGPASPGAILHIDYDAAREVCCAPSGCCPTGSVLLTVAPPVACLIACADVRLGKRLPGQWGVLWYASNGRGSFHVPRCWRHAPHGDAQLPRISRAAESRASGRRGIRTWSSAGPRSCSSTSEEEGRRRQGEQATRHHRER